MHTRIIIEIPTGLRYMQDCGQRFKQVMIKFKLEPSCSKYWYSLNAKRLSFCLLTVVVWTTEQSYNPETIQAGHLPQSYRIQCFLGKHSYLCLPPYLDHIQKGQNLHKKSALPHLHKTALIQKKWKCPCKNGVRNCSVVVAMEMAFFYYMTQPFNRHVQSRIGAGFKWSL